MDREKERLHEINNLAMEQAKDDLTKIHKPYIIKAKDLKKELRRKRHIKDYRKAIVNFLDDIYYPENIKESERHRQYIARILHISTKTVKKYIYDSDETDENKNFPNSSSVF